MVGDRISRSAAAARASREQSDVAPIHRLSAMCDDLAKTKDDPKRPARNAVRMQIFEQLRVIQRNC